MHIASHAPLVQQLGALRGETRSLFLLAHETLSQLDAALGQLPAQGNGALELQQYTARQIVDAIMALDDRRPALVRTWLNQALEARTGRRHACGGAPRAGNGDGAHQLELDI